MVAGLQTTANPAMVGFDAGWKAEFRKAGDKGQPIDEGMFSISRDSYFGEVRFEAATAFRAPSFRLSVEGLSDDDHHKIVGGPYVFVKIFAGWRDLGSGFLSAFSDIASVFTGESGDEACVELLNGRIYTYERLHGDFRYKTEITGIDERYHRMRTTIAEKVTVNSGDAAQLYAKALCEQIGVPIVLHPTEGKGDAIDGIMEIPAHLTVAEALQFVSEHAHSEGAERQIPMFFRTDAFHFGPWTAPVLSAAPDGETKTLDLSTGLVEYKPVAQAQTTDVVTDPYALQPAMAFDVKLRGRADIRLGDLVQMEIDESGPGDLPDTVSSSVLGPLGDVASGVASMFGPAVEPDYTTCRVVSVLHEIDRVKGFVTTLRVEKQEETSSSSTKTETVASTVQRSGDEAAKVAAELKKRARGEQREVRLLNIGEINHQFVKDGTSDNHDVRAQRIDVMEGLERSGKINGAVVDKRVEKGTQLYNKPYVTPFAFGLTGLVVPHYPGMRVVDLHYRENISQSIVAGALWRDGEAPASELGDWWLSLPIDVSASESAPDLDNVELPSGPVTHDLITGAGGRAIHVKGLRISVGENMLPDAGVRPDEPVADEILIEHKSGASIYIDADGNITLSSPKDITFSANKIVMDVQDSVDVQ